MKYFINRIYRGLNSPGSAQKYVWNKCLCYLGRRIHIPFLVIITGQKCTLRCKDCGNFSPLLPQTYYDINSICTDFHKLASVAFISSIQIQGGEALIYPNLPDLIDCVSRGAGAITIATNGTKLLSPEQVKSIISVNARIRISDYNLPTQKGSELMVQCAENNISSFIYKFSGGSGDWLELGDRTVARSSDLEVAKTFSTCPFKNCLTLENGIIARCSRATVSHQIQPFSPSESDFIPVREMDTARLRNRLIDYLRHPIPMEACRYCRGSNGPIIPPAIQMNPNNGPHTTAHKVGRV